MVKIEIQDKYNPNKKWILKKTLCRHYYYTQKIFEKQLVPFAKTTLKFVASVLEYEKVELSEKFNVEENLKEFSDGK